MEDGATERPTRPLVLRAIGSGRNAIAIAAASAATTTKIRATTLAEPSLLVRKTVIALTPIATKSTFDDEYSKPPSGT